MLILLLLVGVCLFGCLVFGGLFCAGLCFCFTGGCWLFVLVDCIWFDCGFVDCWLCWSVFAYCLFSGLVLMVLFVVAWLLLWLLFWFWCLRFLCVILCFEFDLALGFFVIVVGDAFTGLIGLWFVWLLVGWVYLLVWGVLCWYLVLTGLVLCSLVCCCLLVCLVVFTCFNAFGCLCFVGCLVVSLLVLSLFVWVCDVYLIWWFGVILVCLLVLRLLFWLVLLGFWFGCGLCLMWLFDVRGFDLVSDLLRFLYLCVYCCFCWFVWVVWVVASGRTLWCCIVCCFGVAWWVAPVVLVVYFVVSWSLCWLDLFFCWVFGRFYGCCLFWWLIRLLACLFLSCCGEL